MFVYENTQLLEHLEDLLLGGEKNEGLNREQIDETFRVMHTVKGSSAMMEYNDMASLAHAVEDLFSKVREKAPEKRFWGGLFDIVLEAIDFLKEAVVAIQNGNTPRLAPASLRESLLAMNEALSGGAGGEVEKKADSSAVAEDNSEEESLFLDFSEESEDSNDAAIINGFDPSKLNLEKGEVCFGAKLTFEVGCLMESVRALGAVLAAKDFCGSIYHIPENLDENRDETISENGLLLYMATTPDMEASLREKLAQTMFLDKLNFIQLSTVNGEAGGELHLEEGEASEEKADPIVDEKDNTATPPAAISATSTLPAASDEAKGDGGAGDRKHELQSYISVNVGKIDTLMDLVGEIVTAESMVTKDPEIEVLGLEGFEKQSRRLNKLTGELQNVVMSMRMIPFSSTFSKMKRIVRDMSKKVDKKVDLITLGEQTEADKNIIDNLADPLMHIIRNSMDHGLEKAEDRLAAGKRETGTITLEAMNSGGSIVVRVSDDGAGLDRDKLIKKAVEKGITTKNESEISDREAYNFILAPGFSTKEAVTEFSGRGVGMDVVRQNIEKVGGTVTVESQKGKGMSVTLRIPLTLSIIDGMMVEVGKEIFIIPILSIRESLEPKSHKIINEPGGGEFILIRGDCYPVVRLHRLFEIDTPINELNDGIVVLVENENGAVCVFADKLVGEQQAVIKPLPEYMSTPGGKVYGVSGCSIMGNGSIALILDINDIVAL